MLIQFFLFFSEKMDKDDPTRSLFFELWHFCGSLITKKGLFFFKEGQGLQGFGHLCVKFPWCVFCLSGVDHEDTVDGNQKSAVKIR